MKSRIDKLEYKFEKDIDEDLFYYKNKKHHRDKDLPAVIWDDGTRIWYKNGNEHRDNSKPSTIYKNGKMYWFENGKFIKDNLDEIKNR